MHRRLCLLEEEEKVPTGMLKHLWELEGQDEVAVVAREFEQFGFADVVIEKDVFEYREVLRLHESLRQFACDEATKYAEERVGHEVLLRGYGSGLPTIDGCRAWWSTDLNADGYIHSHVCRILLACGRREEVAELLFRPEWTARMFAVCNLGDIERDFDVCRSALRGGVESSTLKALEVLSVAVSTSAPFIRNLREFCFQLYGRLRGHAAMFKKIGEYLNRIEAKGPTPWLRHLNESVAGPNPPSAWIMSFGVRLTCMATMNTAGLVACGDFEGMIHIANVMRGKEESSWRAHEGWVSAIAVSRNGARLVSVSRGTAKVWEADTHRCVAIFEGHTDDVTCAAVMGDGKRAITGSYDGTAQVWDMDTGHAVSNFTAHKGPVWCVIELADGEHVVTGGEDHSTRLWKISKSTQMKGAFLHTSSVRSVALFPDGHRFVSGSFEGWLICDIDTHSQIRKLMEEKEGWVSCVDVSGEGKRIACGLYYGNRISVLDSESGRQVCDPLEGHESHITGVAFLAGGELVVSCSADGTIRLWDVRRTNIEHDRHEGVVTSVSFTPDGTRVVSGSRDGTLRLWDATSGAQIGDPVKAYSEHVTNVVVSQDGRLILSASYDGTVQLWDLESRELVHTFTTQSSSERITCVAVTSNGDHVITGSSDRKVRVWDLKAKKGGPTVLGGHETALRCIFISDDSSRFVSVDSNEVALVWDLKNRRLVKAMKMLYPSKLSLRSRREVLRLVGEATDADNPVVPIQVYDDKIVYGEGSTKKELAILEAGVSSWALSPDNKTICVGLENGRFGFMKL